MLDSLLKRISERDIQIEVSESAREFLARRGYDKTFGARPLRRYIQNVVEDKLAEEMLEGRIGMGDTALVDLKTEDDVEEIVITKKELAPL